MKISISGLIHKSEEGENLNAYDQFKSQIFWESEGNTKWVLDNTNVTTALHIDPYNEKKAKIISDYIKQNIPNKKLIIVTLWNKTVEAFTEDLKYNVRFIDLSNQKGIGITLESIIFLCEMLKYNKTLIELFLQKAKAEAAERIPRVLKINKVHTSVGVNGFKIDIENIGEVINYYFIEGAKTIRGLLRTNRTLEELSIRHNNFERIRTLKGDITLKIKSLNYEGCEIASEMLKLNKLLLLDISKNNIQDKGVETISNALKDLNLGETGIEDKDSINEILKVNTILKVADLNYNYVGIEGAKGISEIPKINTAFTSLNIERAKIYKEAFAAIYEVLKVCY